MECVFSHTIIFDGQPMKTSVSVSDVDENGDVDVLSFSEKSDTNEPTLEGWKACFAWAGRFP